jgi:hypothetical protein
MTPERVYSDRDLVRFLSGKMSAEEADALRARASRDPALAAELALAGGIANAGRDDPERQAPSELVWARISRAIDAERNGARRTPWRAPLALAQMAAAAAIAVSVWHFTVVPMLDRERADPGQYELASSSAAPYSARITFRPTAPESAIRAALLKANAAIRSGPSAIGVYELNFDGAEAQAAGIASLRANVDVVETVDATGSR